MPLIIAYVLFLLDNVLREILRDKNKAKRFQPGADDKRSSILTIFYLFFVPLTPLLTFLNIGIFENSFFQWSGIVLQIIGIGVRILAMQTLGEFYTGTLQVRSNHQLIKSGIYKVIRHPGYFSVLLASIGFGLAIGNWIAFLLILIAFVFTYSYRIRVEEEMLIKKFGSDYTKYMKATKKLIPFIY